MEICHGIEVSEVKKVKSDFNADIMLQVENTSISVIQVNHFCFTTNLGFTCSILKF